MPAVFPRAILCRNVFRFSTLERCEGRSSPVSFQPVLGRLRPKSGPWLRARRGQQKPGQRNLVTHHRCQAGIAAPWSEAFRPRSAVVCLPSAGWAARQQRWLILSPIGVFQRKNTYQSENENQTYDKRSRLPLSLYSSAKQSNIVSQFMHCK